MLPQRIVVKLGTSTLTDGTLGLKRARLLSLVQQVAGLHAAGHEVIMVSSGAQAAGREALGFPQLDKSMPVKQMLSAVGQSRLMQLYADLFAIFECTVAQVLLTRDDLSHRTRYLNARDTLQMLLAARIVPIINENDTVATPENRVGDNDNLAALVASALEADLLVILTDQEGLYTADPRKNADAALIATVPHIDAQVFALGGGAGSKVGTGGMATKLKAAQLASRSGVTCIIARGNLPDVLPRLVAGEPLGTRFLPTVSTLESRKRWLLADRPQGKLIIDDGAARALCTRDGASLLPVGIVAVQGTFKRGATVSIASHDGRDLAHGLSNYDSDALALVLGKQSAQIVDVLGYSYGDEAVHRNNLVLLA